MSLFCFCGRCPTNGVFVTLLCHIPQFAISAVEEDHRLEVIVTVLTVGTLQTGGESTEEDPGRERTERRAVCYNNF